jgi:hypothetical protein
MVKKAVVMVAVIAGFVSAPRPALAQTCTRDLLDCYTRAAKDDNFWYRWADGLDCELQYAGCVRRVLVG